jgi:hypothetical protein
MSRGAVSCWEILPPTANRLPPVAYFFGLPGGVSELKISLFFSM